MTDEEVFSARGWLAEQPEAFRSRIVALAVRLPIARKAAVFHMGDGPGGIFGICSGAIAAYTGTRFQAPALAHVLRAGDWFGYGPTLNGRERRLSFIAAEDGVLLNVPLARLVPLMQEDADAARRIGEMAEIGTLAVAWTARDLLIRNSGQRLAAVLLRVTTAGAVPADTPAGYALSQEELGQMANLSRHSVNRAMQDFQRAGWIAVHYGRVQLLDVPALSAFAYRDE